MMPNMRKTIKLTCEHGDKEFPPEQAQSILRVSAYMYKVCHVSGWELPEDSPYEFINNGLIKRSNTKDSKKSAQLSENSKGDKASE